MAEQGTQVYTSPPEWTTPKAPPGWVNPETSLRPMTQGEADAVNGLSHPAQMVARSIIHRARVDQAIEAGGVDEAHLTHVAEASERFAQGMVPEQGPWYEAGEAVHGVWSSTDRYDIDHTYEGPRQQVQQAVVAIAA